MGTKVSIEKFRAKKGALQCHACQGFYHTSVGSNMSPRRAKCAGEHFTANCMNNYVDPCKCVNCGVDHPANYRACLELPSDRLPLPKSTSSACEKGS